jgi:hypothetical protein
MGYRGCKLKTSQAMCLSLGSVPAGPEADRMARIAQDRPDKEITSITGDHAIRVILWPRRLISLDSGDFSMIA